MILIGFSTLKVKVRSKAHDLPIIRFVIFISNRKQNDIIGFITYKVIAKLVFGS